MGKMSNQPSSDAIEFVELAGCKAQVKEIAKRVAEFAGNTPTEAEALSRCRMVFEYILHETMTHTDEDDWDLEVEIQSEEKTCSD
jgi:hypothetical protein